MTGSFWIHCVNFFGWKDTPLPELLPFLRLRMRWWAVIREVNRALLGILDIYAQHLIEFNFRAPGLTEIQKAFAGAEEKKALVTVNPAVADMLYDEERHGVEEIEKEFAKKIVIKADPNMHQEQFEVVMV